MTVHGSPSLFKLKGLFVYTLFALQIHCAGDKITLAKQRVNQVASGKSYSHKLKKQVFDCRV